MKKLISVILLSLLVQLLFAQTNPNTTTVKSYKKKNGAYVHSYHKTTPNHNKKDNYSSKGNSNPYTGKKGYKKPKD